MMEQWRLLPVFIWKVRNSSQASRSFQVDGRIWGVASSPTGRLHKESHQLVLTCLDTCSGLKKEPEWGPGWFKHVEGWKECLWFRNCAIVWSCHQLAVCLWASYVNSPFLSLLDILIFYNICPHPTWLNMLGVWIRICKAKEDQSIADEKVS